MALSVPKEAQAQQECSAAQWSEDMAFLPQPCTQLRAVPKELTFSFLTYKWDF